MNVERESQPKKHNLEGTIDFIKFRLTENEVI